MYRFLMANYLYASGFKDLPYFEEFTRITDEGILRAQEVVRPLQDRNGPDDANIAFFRTASQISMCFLGDGGLDLSINTFVDDIPWHSDDNSIMTVTESSDDMKLMDSFIALQNEAEKVAETELNVLTSTRTFAKLKLQKSIIEDERKIWTKMRMLRFDIMTEIHFLSQNKDEIHHLKYHEPIQAGSISSRNPLIYSETLFYSTGSMVYVEPFPYPVLLSRSHQYPTAITESILMKVHLDIYIATNSVVVIRSSISNRFSNYGWANFDYSTNFLRDGHLHSLCLCTDGNKTGIAILFLIFLRVIVVHHDIHHFFKYRTTYFIKENQFRCPETTHYPYSLVQDSFLITTRYDWTSQTSSNSGFIDDFLSFLISGVQDIKQHIDLGDEGQCEHIEQHSMKPRLKESFCIRGRCMRKIIFKYTYYAPFSHIFASSTQSSLSNPLTRRHGKLLLIPNRTNIYIYIHVPRVINSYNKVVRMKKLSQLYKSTSTRSLVVTPGRPIAVAEEGLMVYHVHISNVVPFRIQTRGDKFVSYLIPIQKRIREKFVRIKSKETHLLLNTELANACKTLQRHYRHWRLKQQLKELRKLNFTYTDPDFETSLKDADDVCHSIYSMIAEEELETVLVSTVMSKPTRHESARNTVSLNSKDIEHSKINDNGQELMNEIYSRPLARVNEIMNDWRVTNVRLAKVSFHNESSHAYCEHVYSLTPIIGITAQRIYSNEKIVSQKGSTVMRPNIIDVNE